MSVKQRSELLNRWKIMIKILPLFFLIIIVLVFPGINLNYLFQPDYIFDNGTGKLLTAAVAQHLKFRCLISSEQ